MHWHVIAIRSPIMHTPQNMAFESFDQSLNPMIDATGQLPVELKPQAAIASTDLQAPDSEAFAPY